MIGSHVIGLDVGTHAVRAVELSMARGRPVLQKMAQVTLPRGAVVAGEVNDVPIVSSALRRLWREGGFASKEVVVGVANARVVARVADLPRLTEAELRSSLQYQAQDLIPIPADEAELDFQIVDEHIPAEMEGGKDMTRVLLVAAHREMLRSLMAALDGAGLKASRVDLIPFALIRALSGPGFLGEAAGGPEVIVASGAGVTNIVVHQNGIAQFARTLPVGGAHVTDSLAAELGVEMDVAEALKRTEPDHQGASTAVVPLVGDVAGSLDFHLAQGGGGELQRVVLSGGGARLLAFRRVLEDQLGVPVIDGDAFAQLDVSRVNVSPDEAAAARDLFAVAIGLALGGPSGGVTLLPGEVSARRVARKQSLVAAGGVGGFAALLLGLAVMRGSQIDAATSAAAEAEARATTLQSQVAELSDIEKLEADIAAGRTAVGAALAGDVVWPDLVRDVAAVIPDDVWLESFSGSRGAAPGTSGTVLLTAKGSEHPSAARWLLRASELGNVRNVWLTSSTKAAAGGGRPIVSFSSTAELVPDTVSKRLAHYTGEDAQ